jgi:hypothetical protein
MEPILKTKIQQILAVYERFSQSIAAIPDLKAQELYRVAAGVPQFVANFRSVQPEADSSEIESGLEQGLHELPILVNEVEDQWRWAVSNALHDAIACEYPDFLEKDTARISKILARGKISSEDEFYLIRYRIDVLEAQPELAQELQQLYALINGYESKT